MVRSPNHSGEIRIAERAGVQSIEPLVASRCWRSQQERIGVTEPRSHGQLTLELDCSAYNAKRLTFAPAPDGGRGGKFSCSIGPLSEDTLAALDRAVAEHATVRLLFSGKPLLLDLVSLQRADPQTVTIVGHVLRAGPAHRA